MIRKSSGSLGVVLLGLIIKKIIDCLNEFENNYNDIYSDELEPKKENEDPCKASLSVKVDNRKFTATISCLIKERPFPFVSIAFSI